MHPELFTIEVAPKPPGLDAPVDRQDYAEKCSQRWHGEPLRDAMRNFRHFEEWRPKLMDALRSFRANPFQKQPDDTCRNSYGSLTGFLWCLQEDIQPDRSRLDPLLDFCDHHQKVHLRRGLVIYCTALLRIIEAAEPTAA
ncbi:MAG: hypothetical protein R3F13_13190 [Prosthecobacter sp.]